MLKRILFLWTVVSILCAGCKKNDPSASVIFATVDTLITDTIAGDSVGCSIVNAYKSQGVNVITINSHNEYGEGFGFILPGGIVGKYDFLQDYNGTLCEAFFYLDGSIARQYRCISGNITISSNNGHRLEGDFNFNAVDSSGNEIEVKDGKLDVEYEFVFE